LSHGPVGVAYFESGKPPDADVFAELADLGGDHVFDGDGLVPDEGLILRRLMGRQTSS
jgi:hypothetical protein